MIKLKFLQVHHKDGRTRTKKLPAIQNLSHFWVCQHAITSLKYTNNRSMKVSFTQSILVSHLRLKTNKQKQKQQQQQNRRQPVSFRNDFCDWRDIAMNVCDLLEKVHFCETDESMQKFTACCILNNSIKYIQIHMSKLPQMAFHKKLYAN